MRCKKCGREIKYENGRWHHWTKQNHWAIPEYNYYKKDEKKWKGFFIQLIWFAVLTFSIQQYSTIVEINYITLWWFIPLGTLVLVVIIILWVNYIIILLDYIRNWFKHRSILMAVCLLIIVLAIAGQAFQYEKTVSNSANDSYNSDKLSQILSKLNKPKIDSNKLEIRIHELINEQRQQHGLSKLTFDSELGNVARKHSIDMAENDFFDHININNEDPTDRGLKSGYRCHKDFGSYYVDGIGENIFQNNLYDSSIAIVLFIFHKWNTADEIAQSTVDGWMNSPGHRQNILTADYDREGIGIEISSDKEVLVTQNFC